MSRAYPGLLILLLGLGGCSHLTVYSSTDNNVDTYQTNRWHHNLVFESLEVSDPLDPDEVCQGGRWHSISTQHSYASVPLTVALLPFFGPSALGTGLWTPSRIAIECHYPAETAQ